jgi:hypothetical protein
LREGERLVIHHEKEEIQLTRENPLAVRPVSRRGGSPSIVAAKEAKEVKR